MLRRYKSGLVVLLLTCAGLAWFAFTPHSRLEVWLWHLRHGTTATFGEYTLLVPEHWYIESSSERNTHEHLLGFNTDKKGGNGHWNERVGIDLLLTQPVQDMNQWVSENITLLNRNSAGEGARQRLFDLQGETLACVGGLPLTLPTLHSGMRTWHCKSSGRLELLIAAGDQDMNEVWAIVSEIRRRY